MRVGAGAQGGLEQLPPATTTEPPGATTIRRPVAGKVPQVQEGRPVSAEQPPRLVRRLWSLPRVRLHAAVGPAGRGPDEPGQGSGQRVGRSADAGAIRLLRPAGADGPQRGGPAET